MKKKLHHHVHPRLISQLVIIFLAAIFLSVQVVRDGLAGSVSLLAIIIAAVIGLGVGVLSGRIFGLAWHAETEKVIMSMDKMSIWLIVLYIAFRIFSAQLLGDYFTGEALATLSFAVLDGILIGRFVSTGSRIRNILKKEGLF